MFRLTPARRAALGALAAVIASAGVVAQGTTAQAASPLNTSVSHSTLDPGPAPTSLPITATRQQIGILTQGNDADLTVQIVTAGRYTVDYRNLLASVVSNAVDGTALQPVALSDYDTEFSQSFYLNAGNHIIHIGGAQVHANLNVALDGTL